ncbi:MAG: hypothetical protein K6A44_02030 [bacterium]|nr:hypothetical protein [bacterium]
MKKIILTLSLLLISSSAYAWNPFMDKCIVSWIGYPLDSVIKKWGYPDEEKTIAGRLLYIWVSYDYDTDAAGGITVISTDKKGRETVFSAGGTPIIEYCKKTLEVDKNGIVINGQWAGNDCPMFYFAGKNFVNPENDEWAEKKGK